MPMLTSHYNRKQKWLSYNKAEAHRTLSTIGAFQTLQKYNVVT